MSRILLIEDEQGAQLLFKNRLEDLGHKVVIAPTGARGLMEARSGSFDLFLVDVVLGSGIDGFEVCRRIKTIPQTQRIPIVLMSGQLRGREDLHRGYEAGCEAFLLKGDLPLLEDVVRAMLNMKALQDDLAMQNRLLEEQNRRLTEERKRGADLELALRETGNRSLVFRELAAGRPDGLLLVDGEGIVRYADRGAVDVLGKGLEGKNLGTLLPASGLEAFVRDAHTEPREGFRFDVTQRGKLARSLSASVMPLLSIGGGGISGLRAVLLLDAGKRKVAAELLRLQEQGIPRREFGPLLEAARRAFHPSLLLGASPSMTELRRGIARAARGDSHVMVRGESGTGRELVARALHFAGLRSGAFVPVNCAAIAPELVQSELFGHVKDAFDGALSDRPGLLHQADLGTLFLDEVDALPRAEQARLASALKTGEVTRDGGTRAEHVDVRVVASTSADPERLAAEGAFDAELLEALAGEAFYLPPLRERSGDVRFLAQHFLRRFGLDREDLAFSDQALQVMEQYPWPGNVSELEACVERACAVARGEEIQASDLPQPLRDLARELFGEVIVPLSARGRSPAGTHVVAERRPPAGMEVVRGEVILKPVDGVVSLENYERMCLLAALDETRGDKLAAARLLGVGKSTLYRKLKTHGIS